MPQTGRAVSFPKLLACEARRIDIGDLSHRGFFDLPAGISFSFAWNCRGKPSGDIRLSRVDGSGQPAGVSFFYKVRPRQSNEWRALEYIAPLTSTPCHFGGSRYWFVCPLVVNGRACERRCRILYLAGRADYFGCRECLRLTYQSRRNHRENFWETFGRHREFVENVQKRMKPPRGRKAKERRQRRLAIATFGMKYGLDALPVPGSATRHW